MSITAGDSMLAHAYQDCQSLIWPGRAVSGAGNLSVKNKSGTVSSISVGH
jgi:hypothetical protein